jgi:hypothetical protein
MIQNLLSTQSSSMSFALIYNVGKADDHQLNP